MRFQYLSENVVTNIETIDMVVDEYVEKVTLPQGRAWLAKKLRPFFIRNTEFLAPTEEASASAPSYVHDAIMSGRPVFSFSTSTPAMQNFLPRLHHMVDFFNGLDRWRKIEASNRPEENFKRLTEKLVSKLQRMTFEQLEQAHEKWGAMSPTAKSEGLNYEVIMELPGGYKWVTPKDENTHMRLGRMLQNCMQHGTYWVGVSEGDVRLGVLLSPTGEAVVALAECCGGWVNECRGKQNEFPHPKYRDAIIALLKHWGIIRGSLNTELVGAGIAIAWCPNTARYLVGSFDEVLPLVATHNDWKVYSNQGGLIITNGSAIGETHGPNFNSPYRMLVGGVPSYETLTALDKKLRGDK